MRAANSELNQHTSPPDVVEESHPWDFSWDDLPEFEAALPTDRGLSGEGVADYVADSQFSALSLRDRVVIMLLFDQVVQEDQVEQAWRLWRQMNHEGTKEPLWRVLTLFPNLDRELVYAEAARVYGFEEARISRGPALTLVKEMEAGIKRSLWNKMVELRVMPIAEVMQKHTHRRRIVFAASDPTRPEVHIVLPELKLDSYELRYAREGEILNLLIEAFPRRYNHLRGLSGVTKDFLAAVYPETSTTTWLEEAEDGIPEPAFVSTDDWVAKPGSSSLTVFEDVLVEAVRERATDVCLLPHQNGQTDVFYQVHGTLKRQHVIEHIPAKMLLAAVKSGIIRAAGCAEGMIQKRLIQRWVDDKLVRFRVSAVPASAEVHSECIVVRVFS